MRIQKIIFFSTQMLDFLSKLFVLFYLTIKNLNATFSNLSLISPFSCGYNISTYNFTKYHQCLKKYKMDTFFILIVLCLFMTVFRIFGFVCQFYKMVDPRGRSCKNIWFGNFTRWSTHVVDPVIIFGLVISQDGGSTYKKSLQPPILFLNYRYILDNYT